MRISFTAHEYVQNLVDCETLCDKLSKKDVYINSNTKDIYPPHLSKAELLNDVKEGKLYQGTFRASRDNFLEGFVNVEKLDDQVGITFVVFKQIIKYLGIL